MANLQYMPGDHRLIDQLMCELKSRGIFDQFRKECIADVDTKPAYQNLRQRVEKSVSSFLSHQTWKPDMNKNLLRETLRKHILDGNYLEQGVERIVDQVVNPKVASVFIPQVEELVYNFLGITNTKKSTNTEETTNSASEKELLPTDLEAVSPGSVNNEDKEEEKINDLSEHKMEVDTQNIKQIELSNKSDDKENTEPSISQECEVIDLMSPLGSDTSLDKNLIPLPNEEIKVENIPPPKSSPPKINLENIKLPNEPYTTSFIPLPDEIKNDEKDRYFKPINTDDDTSSDSSIMRNVSPLTPIRNYNNENSCDAQQAFESDLAAKNKNTKEPSTFKFTVESKTPENSLEKNADKNDVDGSKLSYQFGNVDINSVPAMQCEDSSSSNALHIDYESDANSKVQSDNKNLEQGKDSTNENNVVEKKNNRHSSHHSKDSHNHRSRSKEKHSKSKSKQSSAEKLKDSKSSKSDHHKSKSSHSSKDSKDKKEDKNSSRHRSSSKSSHHKSDNTSKSSSHRHSSKSSDDRKSSSSNHKNRDGSEKISKDHKISKESKSSSHRSDKHHKSDKPKISEKDKERKSKKESDDHYGLSGRGKPNRRSTDRDSNDGSSSSKGSQNRSNRESRIETSKSNKSDKPESNPTSDSTSPSDNVEAYDNCSVRNSFQSKPIRIETNLEDPVVSLKRLEFVPDLAANKPKYAENFEETQKLRKMRKFLDDEQIKMNQEAALLLEFQANVRPSLNQVYSSIPGPELEFACVSNPVHETVVYCVNTESVNLDKSDEFKNSTIHLTNDYIKNQVVTSKNNITHVDDIINVSNTDNQKIDVCKNFADVDKHTSSYNKLESTDKELPLKNCNEVDLSNEYSKLFEVTVVAEKIPDNDEYVKNVTENTTKTSNNEDLSVNGNTINKKGLKEVCEEPFCYFTRQQKFDADIEKGAFKEFLKSYLDNYDMKLCEQIEKMFIVNCNESEENVFKEVVGCFGEFDVVNYHKNGHLKMSSLNNDISITNNKEVENPTKGNLNSANDQAGDASFEKQKCSFKLAHDYGINLQDLANTTSRQEVMEIILGSGIDKDADIETPKIGYCTESNIDKTSTKRKLDNIGNTVYNNTDNNNEPSLKKIKFPNQPNCAVILKDILSTKLPDGVLNSNSELQKSKFLGRAKRIGLSKPKKTSASDSPSSDQSVENHQSIKISQPHNGKVKNSERNCIQRYDTLDLYKPKLYLSRRGAT